MMTAMSHRFRRRTMDHTPGLASCCGTAGNGRSIVHRSLESIAARGGVLQQYDAPERVFANPINTFVAGFVGSAAMNLMSLQVVGSGDGAAVQSSDGWSYDLSP